MNIAKGSFVGNGTSKSITGIGFTPKLVWLQTQNRTMCWTTDAMSANATKEAGNTATFSGGITSIDSDGFSVGSDARANSNGATIYYLCIGGEENVAIGSYTGNGSSQTVNVGIAPDLAWVWQAGTQDTSWRTTASGGTYGWDNVFAPGDESNKITALGANGFNVGSDARVNSNGVTYYYVCLKQEAGHFLDTNYTGNGVDNTSVSGWGLTPCHVYICRKAPDNAHSCIRWGNQAGDNTLTISGNNDTNRIQAFEADGIQVGTDTRVNINTDVYTVWAFGEGLESVTPVVTDVQPRQFANGDLVEITGTGFKTPQGNGKVELGDNHEYAFANKKQQIIDHWEDLAIRFITDRGSLPNGQVFVFVTNDDGETNDPPPPDDPGDLDTEIVGGVTSGTGSGSSVEMRLEAVYASVAGHSPPKVARSSYFLMSRIGQELGLDLTSGRRSFEDHLIALYENLSSSTWRGGRSTELILRAIEAEL